jgi:hypothetical protein
VRDLDLGHLVHKHTRRPGLTLAVLGHGLAELTELDVLVLPFGQEAVVVEVEPDRLANHRLGHVEFGLDFLVEDRPVDVEDTAAVLQDTGLDRLDHGVPLADGNGDCSGFEGVGGFGVQKCFGIEGRHGEAPWWVGR